MLNTADLDTAMETLWFDAIRAAYNNNPPKVVVSSQTAASLNNISFNIKMDWIELRESLQDDIFYAAYNRFAKWAREGLKREADSSDEEDTTAGKKIRL